MDTLIYLGIGITLGIIAFIIQAHRKDRQHSEEMIRQWDAICAQIDKEHEEYKQRLELNRHPSQDGFTELPDDYEPAGVIHHGEFEITMNGTLYEAIGQPSGLYDLHADGEYVGSYPKHRIMQIIIDHAKENK